MNSTTSRSIVCTTVLLGAALATQVSAADSLALSADTPVVSQSARGPGRGSLRLPALEYQFEVLARCAEGFSPESLSLSAADTRVSLTSDIIDHKGTTEVRLRIPADQIAPVVVEDFCVASSDDTPVSDQQITDRSEEGDRITIAAMLSVSGSLLCKNDEEGLMTYVSLPLDVTLVCERQNETAEN
jgi:hypothetical protein